MQNKWFEIDVDEHLRHKEQVTSEHYQLWKREGHARMHGPLGVEEEHRKEIECEEYDFIKTEKPIMTIHIGPAGFAALDDEETTDLDVWEAWIEGQEYEEMTWACTRGIEIKTSKDQVRAEIRMCVVGTARCWKLADGEHNRHAKFHRVDYTVKINGKPQKVDGKHVKSNRYEGKFEILPDDREVSMEVDGCTVEPHMLNGMHCITVRTADQCLPLGGLTIGVAMGGWMHPLTAEKHAAHFAYEHMQEKFGW
eukprot:gnl/MRDRNA2_/MRDRNA2_86379_c0_seq12.p1 gnl/MRDRNA2_/MRDRNA2_86379_c0~~gnl/MRDRNA2_/MRDRNA2_86379_c0_seq12.p1  ORF type:complete len:267 (-),score=70.55 gnl/MRDRNA2_/MRDRNA2_86379_c0_seq12:136-891(-)